LEIGSHVEVREDEGRRVRGTKGGDDGLDVLDVGVGNVGVEPLPLCVCGGRVALLIHHACPRLVNPARARVGNILPGFGVELAVDQDCRKQGHGDALHVQQERLPHLVLVTHASRRDVILKGLFDGLVQARAVVIKLVVVGKDNRVNAGLHKGLREVDGVLHLEVIRVGVDDVGDGGFVVDQEGVQLLGRRQGVAPRIAIVVAVEEGVE